MLKKYFALFILTLGFLNYGYSQTGTGGIKGKVLDSETGEPLPFVNVVVEQSGRIVTGGSTDFDGKFFIKPLPAGTFDLKVKFLGYAPLLKKGVIVNADKITFADMNMKSSAIEMETYEVVSYKVPLISKDNTSSGSTIGGEDMDKMATRSVAGIAQQVGGVVSSDDGNGSLNFRGARSDANYYFIDGIKVRAAANSLPQSAIEQVSVTTGGIPAQYGDVTGGVVSITTKGAASTYGGSMEYVTSGYRINDKIYGLDPYAYNLLEFSTYGPILWKKDSANKKTSPILGFFLSGNFNYVADPRPSHLGYWKLKDDVRDNLIADPLRYNPSGDGTAPNGEFVRLNDIENVRTKPNAQQYGSSIQGKIDVNTSKNTNLTIGGNFTYGNRKGSSNNDLYRDGLTDQALYPSALMNWANNPRRIDYNSRGFVRFTQRFNDAQSEESSSLIKNAFYTVQFDYSNRLTRIFNDDHKDDLWKYGYVGKFERFESKTYNLEQDSVFFRQAWIHQNWEDTLIGFTPSGDNEALANYTSQYYELYGWEGYDAEGNPVFDPEQARDPNDPTRTNKFLSDVTTMRTNGALFNGDQPRSVIGMWDGPATQYNRNQRTIENQYRLSASGSADIGDHNILIGFEYEQRVDREYVVRPMATPGGTNGLWALGRLYTNSHLEQRDLFNPVIEYVDGLPGDVAFTYPRLNSAPGEYTSEDAQSFFDYNLRKENSDLAPGGADGIDRIDFDNIDPDKLSITYFSADELLNNGNSIVSNYYGFDVYGNKINNNPTIDDFFQAEDEFGNKTRPIGAFRPIYIAGYIQDKFAFDDLVFNIGLRVDRYDANQSVLSDPYVFFPTIKAGEDAALELADGAHPENIGEDFVVYVDDLNQPTTITGYRDGNNWYNKEGVEIANPDALATSSGIAPLLVDKERTRAEQISSDGFEDYKPQTNFMPRIAFSFPISDEALFFAHYDILTKRPTTGERLDPTDYLFVETTNRFNVRNNPNLQAEKTIDYEAGFQQKLTNTSSIKISTFYREFRDQVQVVRVKQAFPAEYSTFGNVDFGTVKGLTFAYDMRRTGNVSLRGSYTIQFAEGTGSDATTANALINAGFDNLKVTSPLNYDQRHTIQAVLDYRYSSGKDYNGPIIAGKQVLANTGANLTMLTNSGRPFNGQSESTGRAFITDVGNAFLDGSINGNNLPWSFKIDARVDKDFQIKVGKDKEKALDMTVYLQILNVLNNQNILSVNRYTADPLDDGYLADARWTGDIESQNDTQSFEELYRIKNAVGSNFNLPRRFRLGVRLAF